MFGYVKTDTPNMYVKDTVLYKAMYCGLCKGIGKVSGQRARLVLNYDLTFLSVLLHNLAGIDVKIEKQRCIAHQIRKRPVAIPDELTEKIGAFNVILAKYKILDDVYDSGNGKIKNAFFNKAYKKAKKFTPELDEIVDKNYKILREYEKNNSDSVDMVADSFGNMISQAVQVLLKDKVDENLTKLCYNLGKWIYLIDALDDFDKDKKKGNFNVFINMYKDVIDKKSLMELHKDYIVEIFSQVIVDIEDSAKKLDYKFNHDLTDNVLTLGLKQQTKTVMEKTNER
ncbi:MAG: hypothetical protein IKA12_00055 [Clostridia bacterium]|nr:hypothetical protein [Clostridia bacterium]